MTAYEITYDLNRPGQNYPDLIAYLDRLGGLHYQKSAWLARYHGSAAELRATLMSLVDHNDSINVAEVNTANCASGDPNVSLWSAMVGGMLKQPGLESAAPSSASQPGLLGAYHQSGPFWSTSHGKPENSLLGSFLDDK